MSRSRAEFSAEVRILSGDWDFWYLLGRASLNKGASDRPNGRGGRESSRFQECREADSDRRPPGYGPACIIQPGRLTVSRGRGRGAKLRSQSRERTPFERGSHLRTTISVYALGPVLREGQSIQRVEEEEIGHENLVRFHDDHVRMRRSRG